MEWYVPKRNVLPIITCKDSLQVEYVQILHKLKSNMHFLHIAYGLLSYPEIPDSCKICNCFHFGNSWENRIVQILVIHNHFVLMGEMVIYKVKILSSDTYPHCSERSFTI